MKPDFIGISPGRTGTAWIHNCLIEHPRLCLPFKIVNYFNDNNNFEQGDEWYESHFRTCDRGQLSGEMSLYLHTETAAQRIFDYHPTVKLLIFLRDPVERAFASYENELTSGAIRSSMRFEEAVELRPTYLERGYYLEALKRYLDIFPKDQVSIRIYEEGVSDPERYVREIFEFLEVDSAFEPSMLREWVSTGGVPRSSAVTKAMNDVAGQMRRMGLQNLMWLVKKTGMVKAVHKANRKSVALPMTESKRKELYALFESDIRDTQELVGLDLSAWSSDSIKVPG
jgi:hypothetical protein